MSRITKKVVTKNWIIWVGVILGIILLLAIVVWYWKLGNRESFAATTTTTQISTAKYPFIWRINDKGELNDKNNPDKHQAILYTDIPDADGKLIPTPQITINGDKAITEKTTTVAQGITLDFKDQIVGLNTSSIDNNINTREYLQLLPSTTTDIWQDYYVLNRKSWVPGFTICMWVRFPGVRTAITNDGFQKTGESECLVEIMKPGAETDATNTGAYFTITRATNNNLPGGTNNNKISCGFSDPKLRLNSKTVFDKDTWNHIAITLLPGRISLFVNGIIEDYKSVSNIDKNTIFMGDNTIFNIGKNSRSLATINNCNSCAYAKFYMADLQLHQSALTVDIIKQICLFSDITKKKETLNMPYNWKVGKINSVPSKTAFIDENNTPYNFKIDGINNPISSDTINKQIKFDEDATDMVNISNNYLQFLPQRYTIPGTKILYDNTDAFRNYEFMKNGFTLEINCKFANTDLLGKPYIYTPFNGQSEYIMEIFKNGAESGGSKYGGYLFIARRPRDVKGNPVDGYTNYISVGVLGKEIRSKTPLTDNDIKSGKIHSFRIIFQRGDKDKHRLYFYLNNEQQKQYIDNKNTKDVVDYLTLLDSEIPMIDATTKFNVGYGSREKDKTTRLSIKSVVLSDSIDLTLPTTTTTSTATTTTSTATTTTSTATTTTSTATTTTSTDTTTTSASAGATTTTSTSAGATTSTSGAQLMPESPAITPQQTPENIPTQQGEEQTTSTQSNDIPSLTDSQTTNSEQPKEFKWTVAIKNGTNIMGAGQNMMDNQIVSLMDVQPSNTPQQIKLDVYEGDIIGLNLKQNTTNSEYLKFLPNPTNTTNGNGSSGIIGFKDYDFLTPSVPGQGFTISMTVRFKSTESAKSETLFEFFDPSNASKYFYIKRLAKSVGGDKNKIIAGYSDYSGYAEALLPITDNLWNHIAVSCVNDANKQNNIIVYLNGAGGSVVDFDYPRCVFSLTDKSIINIGKKSFTKDLPNDSIRTTPANSYSAILVADLQLTGKVLNAAQIKNLATTSITNLPIEILVPIFNPSMFSFATVPVQMS